MSGRAVACLKTVMNSGVELLPLTWDRERLYSVNVTTVLDGLDEAQSQILWLLSGPLFAIKQHTFIRDVVRGHVVFKVKQDCGSGYTSLNISASSITNGWPVPEGRHTNRSVSKTGNVSFGVQTSTRRSSPSTIQ